MLRRFRRLELKYLLPLWKCRQIVESLEGSMSRDDHSAWGSYTVTSLYYDSYNLRCFWANGADDDRRTVRLRVYPTGGVEATSIGVVEVKQRTNELVEKRRLPLPLGVAERLCSGHLDEALHVQLPRLDREVALEVIGLVGATKMRPVAITSYRRMAFVDNKLGPGLRVTFDTELRGRVDALQVNRRARNHRILEDAWCVMEVKSQDVVPEWLASMLARHGAQAQRLSKYRLAMSRLSGGSLPPRRLASLTWAK